MSSDPGSAAPAQRVKAFLLGFRWFALVLGLILTSFNNSNPLLYAKPPYVPNYVTAIMILMVQGGLTMVAIRTQTKNAAGLVFVDVVLGLVLAYTYHMGYFILGGVLPVVEATYYFGGFGGFLTGIACGICTLGLGVYHLFLMLTDPATVKDPQGLQSALALALGHQMAVAIVMAALLSWVVSSIRLDEGDIEKAEREAKEKVELLSRELNDSSADTRQFIELAENRQQQMDSLESQLHDVADELELVHKELHEKKAQVQAMQQMAQKKEQQQGAVHKREVEELKADVDQLHHHLDRVTILVDITRDLHRSIHLNDTFLAVLTGALKLVRSQTGILFILDESQSPAELFPEAAAGPYQQFFTNYSFKIGEGLPGWVAARLQPVKIDNETTMVDGEPLSSLVSYEKSAMVVPLFDADKKLGVLYLGRPDANSFSDEEVEDLIEFCRHASRAVTNASDYHRAVTHGIIDEVTGLYNQMYFSERLREEEKRSKRYQYPVTLMLIDIDNFTQYNSTYGHDRGNMLLKELAEILREHTRETDVAARLQNDEFGVLLVESEKKDAILIGERIRMALEVRYSARMGKARNIVTVSLGLSTMPSDTRDAAELYQYAEAALVGAKRSGGNKSMWHGPTTVESL